MKASRSVGPVRRACRLFALGCTVAVFSAACGDDDDDDDPKSQCERFERTYCDKITGCLVEEGLLASSERTSATADCIDEIDAAIGCANAVAIESSYDECLDDIRSAPCDFVVEAIQSEDGEIPDSCMQVILVD
jgi:hypothetical protein